VGLSLSLASLLPGAALADLKVDLSEDVEVAKLRRVTSKVYLDIGLCPTAFRSDRRLGDKSALCEDPSPVGRIVLGLYGDAAPSTVANMLTLVRGRELVGTTFQRVFPGEYISAGAQGSRRYGKVEVSDRGQAFSGGDLTSSTSFLLRNTRPGTLSLALADPVNNDEEPYRERPGYVPLGFVITTGPGPVPSLDGRTIVFGQVLEGLGTVSAIAAVPAYNPAASLGALNFLGQALQDERAAKAQRKWGTPLKAVVITGAGEMG